MTLSAVSVRDTCFFFLSLLNLNTESCMLTINRCLLIVVPCNINCMILKVSEQLHRTFLLLNRAGTSRSWYLLFKVVFVTFCILASAKRKLYFSGQTYFPNYVYTACSYSDDQMLKMWDLSCKRKWFLENVSVEKELCCWLFHWRLF